MALLKYRKSGTIFANENFCRRNKTKENDNTPGAR